MHHSRVKHLLISWYSPLLLHLFTFVAHQILVDKGWRHLSPSRNVDQLSPPGQKLVTPSVYTLHTHTHGPNVVR